MSDPILFEDTFTITSINAQKYDRVSRISCTSTDQLTTFTLDVNSELYPCAPGESLSLALASTLALDGKDEGAGGRAVWRDVGMGETTLANDYDYVCYGKVYRFEDSSTAGNMAVFVSFGGLLLYLDGPYKKLNPLRIDYVYLLIKK
ncbi:DNA-directed RNA polymerases I, II, and III subunit RPABC3 [Coccidioides posadasii str. Silveira]|uniref:DNA-directed RNA polymerases I, II, and III subunit RPABC3 n=3 Tax=Coccidioides posadasii TaxID=199306 RepID=E9DHH7_COCPS|nr:RNA polymerase Rpb8 family protein [Coccidioides posadasii C735 delta SOWgp]EER24233.1 RNA polymerase Rpb8 family protein [Coccidioides posadasii C735 delta SOWgp]EFW14202.1 DNA-directed RNA polymerase I [Coccidioides posadasii str. Silveira]KMM65865.1 DNA-directed RNA polymerases i [Coccidioides posadasii RMSCC 3488]QVM07742.1 DNA-directed RNA polymerases I, II, and III subunit RPABC3 [Coccidioides posadasii str. Silveira]|eukprot:XP_003066378.1 RNA polymerase Rpb8 family protein [Coccidioides posadasii C735 delta SOWgp]